MKTQRKQRMQCSEVWGGNRSTDTSLATAGLDIWVYSHPHAGSDSGGDVYYLSACASGRVTRMLVADVAGHGSSVSGIAQGLRDLMRRKVNYIEQNRLVGEVNQQFAIDAPDGRFATAVIGTFFAPTRSLQLSNAGHPIPLVYRTASSQWKQLELDRNAERDNVPLGILGDAQYDSLKTQLEIGDLLLLFTDSLIESLNERGEMLSGDGLLEVVKSVDTENRDAFIPELLNRLRKCSERNLTDDDVTVLLLHANGSGATLRDNLLSPFRLVADLFRH